MKQLNKYWLNSIPKTVNENGCWLPEIGTLTDKGYILLQVDKFRFTLSRMSMCITNDIDYFDDRVECRHKEGCKRACFNPEHLLYGSHADNIRDTIEHRTHHNSAKDVCPKCGGEYHFVRATKFSSKRIIRRCRKCFNENRKVWRARNK